MHPAFKSQDPATVVFKETDQMAGEAPDPVPPDTQRKIERLAKERLAGGGFTYGRLMAQLEDDLKTSEERLAKLSKQLSRGKLDDDSLESVRERSEQARRNALRLAVASNGPRVPPKLSTEIGYRLQKALLFFKNLGKTALKAVKVAQALGLAAIVVAKALKLVNTAKKTSRQITTVKGTLSGGTRTRFRREVVWDASVDAHTRRVNGKIVQVKARPNHRKPDNPNRAVALLRRVIKR